MNGGGRVGFLCGFLASFLLLCSTNADGEIKEVVDPTGNVNLTPFDQWHSAYQCLQNTSESCPDKYKLTEKGLANLTQADTQDYCKPGGCVEHTSVVITCLHLVKRDYKFMDTTGLHDVNFTIINGCSKGFKGKTLIASDARKMGGSKITLFVSIVSALVLSMKYVH